MTRYLDVSMDIARRVAAGEFEPGSELPSVRDVARRKAMTVSTVTRAYHHLADAGVITSEGRRRARVAPHGTLAARHFLAGDQVFRLAGSDDPALDLLLRRIDSDSVTTVGTRNSFAGLTALSRGNADGAAIHLKHRTGEYNAPFAQALLRGREPHLIHLWAREQGMVVAPDTTIAAASDLGGRRVARRAVGSGTRVLADQVLSESGVDPDGLSGPIVGSHLEVALAVAAGMADAGFGVRAAAVETGLTFIPLVWEQFDVALPAAALGAANPLVTALGTDEIRSAIGELGGYDLTGTGRMRRLA